MRTRYNKGDLYVVLPNIRSLHNVGSVFRTSDCLGVKKIFLCGYTGKPPASQLVKVSLGAEDVVAWEYVRQVDQVFRELKAQKVKIIGLELTNESLDYRKLKIKYPCALVLGNEVQGLSPYLQKKCDKIMHLPMLGIKESLNVSVAFGIAAYQLRFGKL